MQFKQSLKDNESIRLKAHAKDWKEAIKLGTDMLVAAGCVKPSYHDAIIKGIEDIGPYILIAPGLAFPHARPEDGVVKTAFALVTLSEAVSFDPNEAPVDVLIFLAGINPNDHMEGLQEITSILEDDESESGINLEQFRQCQSVDDVYYLLDINSKTID